MILRFVSMASLLMIGALALPAAVHADFTFDFIDGGYATGISADGFVVVGNTIGIYETFRWTVLDGLVPLGRATVPVLGSGAGTPAISADGTRISATILGSDSTYSTQGLWIQGSGWQELMPPTLPDGGLLDNSYGSAWGLSGDGSTPVGLYWRPGQPGGAAHASRWTEATGIVDLGSGGRSSRASGVDLDGNVIVGFDEHASGPRLAAVWENGVKTILDPIPDASFSEAIAVNPAGTRIVGRAYDPARTYTVASIWRKIGSNWSMQRLGALPGTMPSPGFGFSIANDLSADGTVVVGYNRFNEPSNATGFIWTQASGMVDVVDYLADHGIVVPGFDILSLTAITDDGKTMVGQGQQTVAPFVVRSFIIRTDVQTSVATTGTPARASSISAFPNPTRGSTTFSFELPSVAPAELSLFDVRGRLVCRLSDGPSVVGMHQVDWDGRDAAGAEVPSGIYYYRVTSDGRSELQKLIVTH